MKTAQALFALVLFAGFSPAQAQTTQSSSPSAQGQQGQSAPLYRITVVGRTTKAVNYSHNSSSTKIDFRGTPLLPYAKGVAKVENKRGAVRIQAQFEQLQPAGQFGPEYLTYVLWAVTPEGRPTNLGELQAQSGKYKVDVTAHPLAFAMIVTAEPYFAVSQPSDVVVLENIVRPDTSGQVQEIDAKFELLQRGQYSTISSNATPARMDAKTPLALYEARNAVQIAKGAGADSYAKDSFRKAEQLLEDAESVHARKADKKAVESAAREAVQTAEDARSITMKRREDERLAQERQAAQEREARARAETEAAQRAKLEAQLATERAARERAEAEAARASALEQQRQSEAARASALEQQHQAEATAEKARLDAQRSAQERAEAEAARAMALEQQHAAQADAERSRQAAEESERQRKQAEAEKGELRARLLDQLNRVLQTRDSVRGLIVNMSDVLFDTGSYTLKPGAREKLAKVSGIVIAYPGLNLQVEGHTDIVGGDDFNQRLSEQRAGSVRDFLVQQGVQGGSVTSRGFGKTQPVASNDTPEGRQQNRRVEIVVSGEAINATSAGSAPAKP